MACSAPNRHEGNIIGAGVAWRYLIKRCNGLIIFVDALLKLRLPTLPRFGRRALQLAMMGIPGLLLANPVGPLRTCRMFRAGGLAPDDFGSRHRPNDDVLPTLQVDAPQ
jgi:hypothetical protein